MSEGGEVSSSSEVEGGVRFLWILHQQNFGFDVICCQDSNEALGGDRAFLRVTQDSCISFSSIGGFRTVLFGYQKREISGKPCWRASIPRVILKPERVH